MSHPSSIDADLPLSTRRLAPGPSDPRATTQAMERDPLRFLLEMTRQYGDVVHLPLTVGSTYLVNHPDGVHGVLYGQAGCFGKDPHENSIFKRFVGESILTTEGERWKRLRKLEQPAFGSQHSRAISAQIVATTQKVLATWQDQAESEQIIDLVPAMQALTLRVLGSSIFSLDLSSEVTTVTQALHVINRYALCLFYRPWLPYLGPLSSSNRHFWKAQRDLDRLVYRLIRHRRKQLDEQAAPPEDLLTFFLNLKDADGTAALSNAQLRNETLSLLIAGHDNSSSLLCWAWYLLASHPEVAQEFFQEVATTLSGQVPTYQDLERLPLARLIVEEALRLYPPAWSYPRRALVDVSIGGYTIPAGSTVLLCPYSTHRHPAFWSDPESFHPERFHLGAAGERPRLAYFPFGGGQHQCMGSLYALIEAQLVLITMAQQYRLELIPGRELIPEPFVTLRPRALPMRLRFTNSTSSSTEG